MSDVKQTSALIPQANAQRRLNFFLKKIFVIKVNHMIKYINLYRISPTFTLNVCWILNDLKYKPRDTEIKKSNVKQQSPAKSGAKSTEMLERAGGGLGGLVC